MTVAIVQWRPKQELSEQEERIIERMKPNVWDEGGQRLVTVGNVTFS